MKYDSILYLDNDLDEIYESDRMNGVEAPNANIRAISGSNALRDDPSMYNSFTFGRIVRSSLEGMGAGWSTEVSDFKKWVVVTVKYYNYETSRSASKTFLIVFKHKGDGTILSTHNRYRTINGVNQALSYIKSTCHTIQNSTQNKI